jgi:hypothetical protein
MYSMHILHQSVLLRVSQLQYLFDCWRLLQLLQCPPREGERAWVAVFLLTVDLDGRVVPVVAALLSQDASTTHSALSSAHTTVACSSTHLH